MPDTRASRKPLFLFIGALALIVFVFLGYYLYWYSSQAQYFALRNERELKAYASQIKDRIEGLETIMKNAFREAGAGDRPLNLAYIGKLLPDSSATEVRKEEAEKKCIELTGTQAVPCAAWRLSGPDHEDAPNVFEYVAYTSLRKLIWRPVKGSLQEYYESRQVKAKEEVKVKVYYQVEATTTLQDLVSRVQPPAVFDHVFVARQGEVLFDRGTTTLAVRGPGCAARNAATGRR